MNNEDVMYKVLIVDDEVDICRGLQILIDWESFGFEVSDFAFNGVEALKKIEKFNYHVVITDIRMPDMDGIKLITKLHNLGNMVKVVLLSGYKDFDYARTAILCGVKNYILKPINDDILIDTLKSIRAELDKEKMKFNDDNIRNDNVDNSVIQKIIDDINNNFYREDISLKEKAKSYYMNPTYLGRLFKKTTGMNFNDYLNKVRISNSVRMLENNKYKIYEICEKVGFKDINYFNRLFKNMKGVTPSEYKYKFPKSHS